MEENERHVFEWSNRGLADIAGDLGEAVGEISSINNNAAEKLANGTFGNQLLVRSEDEVGELTCNFNKMTQQTLLLKQAILLFKRCF